MLAFRRTAWRAIWNAFGVLGVVFSCSALWHRWTETAPVCHPLKTAGRDPGLPEAGQHRLCIVVPFRNRFDELLRFVPHMGSFLEAKGIRYCLVVINQSDGYRFNRASLVNVGFLEARRLGCDYFAMHDVDLLPLNPELDYGFPSTGVYHVSSPLYHPLYRYRNYIGGILILSNSAYVTVNGMSNKYWGWGLEDDEFFLRLMEAGFKIDRPRALTTNSSNTFVHIHNRDARRRDNYKSPKQLKESRRRDRVTGLSTVSYDIVDRTDWRINGSQVLMVNVALHCDTKLTPWCLPGAY